MTDTKKPEALRLAEFFETDSSSTFAEFRAATELRRLHELNVELQQANADMLSALRAIVAVAEFEDSFSMQTIKDCANIAIKQAGVTK
jgi:hypothetical protein